MNFFKKQYLKLVSPREEFKEGTKRLITIMSIVLSVVLGFFLAHDIWAIAWIFFYIFFWLVVMRCIVYIKKGYEIKEPND